MRTARIATQRSKKGQGSKGSSSKERASIDFSLQTVVTMMVVLIGGALILYFMYVFLYKGKIAGDTGMLSVLKNSISGVMDPYG